MVLNLKEKVTVGGVTYAGAVGDGVADDTASVQGHLLALRSYNDNPTSPYAALYVPAGIYRITAPLDLPWLINARIFGDGGRGGQQIGGLAFGSLFVQSAAGQPIFRLNERDTQALAIERLGFTWDGVQEPPPGWTAREPHLKQLPTQSAPGAVGILLTAGARGVADGAFYHLTIRDCRFEGGWRGVAIDDTYDAATISVWETHIERCSFHGMRGAAISLVNHPDHFIGMPSNAITDCFIENYSNPDGSNPGIEYSRRNAEPQIRVAAQTAMRIDGLDAEGSKVAAFYASDSTITFRSLYFEHLKIGYQLSDNGNPVGLRGAPYAHVVGLYGGEYAIEGLHLDGTIDAHDPSTQPRTKTFSRIIHAESASVTVGAARARPVSNPLTADLDTADGFHVEGGPALFVHTNAFTGGALARFRMLGDLRLDASSRTSDPFVLFDGSQDGNTSADALAERVEREPRVVRVSLSFPSIPAGRIRTPDNVALAPPANFPASCLATGHVTGADQVEVRVFNSGTAAVSVPTGVWTVAYGRGANGILLPPGS